MGKIILPQSDSIKNALEKKLAEYKGRLADFERVPLTKDSSVRQIDSVYKITIVEELFKKGEIDFKEMQTILEKNMDF